MKKLWPVWAILIFAALLWWPGKPLFMTVMTNAEAARIASITPDSVADEIPERLDIDRMMTDLHWLAHPDREGRLVGSAGGAEARGYIVERFEELGLYPAGTYGFLHPFELPDVDGAANVIGYLPGTREGLDPIAITAHYDHLGVHEGRIYHGADDNASGTAALMEIARYFTENPTQHPLLFMALDAEEGGLRGARALFSTGLFSTEDIAFNVNMDMMSRDTDELLYAVGTWHYPWLRPLVKQVQQESGAKLIMAHDRPWWKAGHTMDWTWSSDHGPFHDEGIPFIYFGVADHPDYHQPTDTSDKTNVEFYRRTSETALSFILLIDEVLPGRNRF